MGRDIRTCSEWRHNHQQPRYTLESICPACAADTVPAAPARFSPKDPYGRYRRALRERTGEQ